MNAAFTHREEGTVESVWAPAMPDLLCRTVNLDAHRPVIVVGAHPDDETLAAGGLIAITSAAGVRPRLLVCSDGDASHPRSESTTPPQLARTRRGELAEAVRLLAPGTSTVLLHLPDGRLGEHRQQITVAVERLVAAAIYGTCRPLLVAPWRGDGHPDHDVVGEIAAAVAARHGCELWEYPIWAWHWATPSDTTLPWRTAVRLPLDEHTQVRKRAAIAAHRSQTRPLSPAAGDETLLHRQFLDHFTRPYETYFRSPEPESLAPAYFEALYERFGSDPWGLVNRWYEQRKRAVCLAALPRKRFGHAFEPGCSIGTLTTDLAERCDTVVAMDPVECAVDAARRAVSSHPNVAVVQGSIPRGWPSGVFDLIVISEVGYYLTGVDLLDLADRCRASLTVGGVVLACHWRHDAAAHPSTADHVHETLRSRAGLVGLVHHEETDFLLDVLIEPPAVSVAAADGLLG